ncbi:hypothetical protein HNP71_002291 [Acidocella aromatica]|uniref:Uncharacterized protein n=1 Tax=Acidocella aromatica TaxID=1303579 RepID=A0A840VE68_9PROT|nr:hypothetical protein [Acidocella aromatica]
MHPQDRRSSPKAAMVCCGDHIADVANLDGQCRNSSTIAPLLLFQVAFKNIKISSVAQSVLLKPNLRSACH